MKAMIREVEKVIRRERHSRGLMNVCRYDSTRDCMREAVHEYDEGILRECWRCLVLFLRLNSKEGL